MVYFLVAMCKTIVEISGPAPFITKLQETCFEICGPSTFIMKLEGILTITMHTANFAPTHAILFIRTWMRALQTEARMQADRRLQWRLYLADRRASRDRAPKGGGKTLIPSISAEHRADLGVSDDPRPAQRSQEPRLRLGSFPS